MGPTKEALTQSVPIWLQNFSTAKNSEHRSVGEIHAMDGSAFNSAIDVLSGNPSNAVSSMNWVPLYFTTKRNSFLYLASDPLEIIKYKKINIYDALRRQRLRVEREKCTSRTAYRSD